VDAQFKTVFIRWMHGLLSVSGEVDNWTWEMHDVLLQLVHKTTKYHQWKKLPTVCYFSDFCPDAHRKCCTKVASTGSNWLSYPVDVVV